jgi:hypothetical protein
MADGKLSAQPAIVAADLVGTDLWYISDISASLTKKLTHTEFLTLIPDVSALAPLASPTFTGTVAGITKSMVGLGSADNTSDADKPVSTAQLAALDLKAPLASPTFSGSITGAKTLLTSALVTDVTLQLKAAVGTQSVNILELLDAAGSVMSRFDQTGQLSVGGVSNSAGYNIAGNGLYVNRYSRNCYYGSSGIQFTSGNFEIYDTSAIRWTFKNGGVMNFANMPTSSAGLATGDLWSNSGVITIV